jgi:2-oxo-3-hexenedioate decarboxylase
MNRREANERNVAELLQARDAVRRTLNPSHFGFDLTLGRAYQIGRRLHERLEARGFRPVGRKIGFTNRALWEQFRVTEPIWAHVYAQTVHRAGEGHAHVALGAMVAPRLEPEIVLKLCSDLPGGEPAAEELARCIEWVAVGFEIVDSHYADWRFTAAEAVADFGVHPGLVVGAPWRVESEDPAQVTAILRTLKVTLHGGNGFRAEGEGSNALGSPLLALGFLAKVLAAQPWAPPLAAGEVVTTGTLTALPYLRPGESYRVEVAGAPLTPVQLDLDEGPAERGVTP